MSEYIAAIGEKVSCEVKMIRISEYTDYKFSYYGTTHYIYVMRDSDDNVIVWKSTSIMGFDIKEGIGFYSIKEGDAIRITGKVKSHDEYKGTKQTTLTRCKYELISKAPTKEEVEEQKRKEQLESLNDGDFIWKEMPYKQYKEHYADCETVVGSYRFDRYEGSMIDVIIRNGRLKNNGVRGQHFFGFQFRTDEGHHVSYRAVCEENARKQLLKDYPNGESFELLHVYPHFNIYRNAY